ncbi:MAG: serine hydrolase [Gemmatimonadaceae bacterium]
MNNIEGSAMKFSLGSRSLPSVTVVLAALHASISGSVKAQPPATPAAIEQLVPAIDAYFRRFQETAHAPGLVYGIVRDGKLVHVSAMGVQDLETQRPVDAQTLFRIATSSKRSCAR